MDEKAQVDEFYAQRRMIYEWLLLYGSITPMDAINNLGCLRLGARIFELRHDMGLNIVTHTEIGKNRFGKRVRYARYVLEKQDDDNETETKSDQIERRDNL